MSQIIIGKTCDEKSSSGARWRNVGLDLDVLLRTRLLVQANSGGGKSWLLRRLAEQLFGKVQVIIIDREGEFASLREKFDYILAGQGGDTPADIRSAKLLAQRLLELRASAICDLYEAFRSKPGERRAWVRAFLESLVDAPKKYWRPLVVIVDEAHQFCPQETPKAASMIEREVISGCKDAMISLATVGRKRGFCAIWATQRLAKLDKDASAELFNRLVGMTIEDVDVDRAADLMSVSKGEKADFKKSLKTLEPGDFYAFGRAITKDRLLLRVGPIETTHPELGTAGKHAAEPPPPSAKIRAMLPKLKDLPQAAEEKARTEAEFRGEIRSLKAQLRSAASPAAGGASRQPSAVVGRARPCALPHADPRALEQAVKKIDAQRRQELAGRDRLIQQIAAALAAMGSSYNKAAQFLAEVKKLPAIKAIELPKFLSPPVKGGVSVAGSAPKAHPPRAESHTPRSKESMPPPEGVTRRQLDILRALAEFEAIGRNEIPRTWVAVRAGARHRSSAYSNNLGALRSAGLIEYGANSSVRLSASGREIAPPIPAPLSTEEMLESCLKILSAKQGLILKALHEIHPQSLSREEVAERAGTSPLSSAYTNNLGALRSAGMIEYGPGSTVKCTDWLFID